MFIPFLHALEHGAWSEHHYDQNEIVMEWWAYEVPDENVIMQLKQEIPVYAKAMVPFQVETIKAFRELPPDKQTKIERYLDYPEEYSLESWLPFLEANLADEIEQDIEGQVDEPTGSLHYLVMAKSPEGKLLGFANFNLVADRIGEGAELEPIMIDPDAQGKGLARKLIFSILQLRPELSRVYLCVNALNLKARKIYERLGFEEAGVVRLHDIDWEYGVGLVMDYVPKGYREPG